MQVEAKSKLNPLLATASIAVIVLAAVGVAAFTGVLPGSVGSIKPEAAPASVQPKTTPAKPKQVAVAPPAAAAKPKCLDCGVVQSVVEVEVKGKGTGAGAVAGGVAGAVIGNQIGEGSGKTAARVIGAAGGAVIGHQVERSVRSTKRHDITVRMEDGSERTVSQEQTPTWRSGDKVRVVNDALQPQ